VFSVSTVCTLCGNSHNTPRETKNCEIRSRKQATFEEENAEVVEYIMNLTLHMKMY
jgi:hypothetical protein